MVVHVDAVQQPSDSEEPGSEEVDGTEFSATEVEPVSTEETSEEPPHVGGCDAVVGAQFTAAWIELLDPGQYEPPYGLSKATAQ